VVLVYSPRYTVDIGPHVFITEKYRLTRDRLVAAGVVAAIDVLEPGMAGWDDLALVHDPEYLDKVRNGTLTAAEIATLELPWSREMVDGFRMMVGGTVLAARQTLDGPGQAAANIGGGLHHGFARHGEGFCVFNDVAVAIRRLTADGRVRRVAVIDLDVHHGNGTAAIFARDPNVFTFSMHQEHNYPVIKPPGTLDIGLQNGTRDEEYLEKLEGALPAVCASNPDLVFYLAGADPYRHDQLGGLSLTFDGLRRRDSLVFSAARQAGVPVTITLAGGYASRLDDTVAIHVATIEAACEVFG
jgi:acetoin utilization deacetylase AcuC-like enzyme